MKIKLTLAVLVLITSTIISAGDASKRKAPNFDKIYLSKSMDFTSALSDFKLEQFVPLVQSSKKQLESLEKQLLDIGAKMTKASGLLKKGLQIKFLRIYKQYEAVVDKQMNLARIMDKVSRDLTLTPQQTSLYKAGKMN